MIGTVPPPAKLLFSAIWHDDFRDIQRLGIPGLLAGEGAQPDCAGFALTGVSMFAISVAIWRAES
jgi:hypothetical protein